MTMVPDPGPTSWALRTASAFGHGVHLWECAKPFALCISAEGGYGAPRQEQSAKGFAHLYSVFEAEGASALAA